MKVLTQDGFKDFDGVRITENSEEKLYIKFNDTSIIKCTKKHRFLLYNTNEFIEAEKLSAGDHLYSKNGKKTIVSIKSFDENCNVYDLINVKDTNSYFTNNVISHNCLYLDEFAHVENAEEFYTSTYPVVSSSKKSKIIITSTPKGMNLFYKIYTQAEEGTNEYTSLKYDWRCVPGRDQKWYEMTKSSMSDEQFAQEFEGSFIGSSNTLLTTNTLLEMCARTPKGIGLNNSYRQYVECKKDHKYAITVDVSRGKGLDNSAFSVVDITNYPFEQVATYYNSETSPLIYPSIIKAIAQTYNDAAVLIEINDIGEEVQNILLYDLEYENIVSFKYGQKYIYGVRTTKSVKAAGCSVVKDLIEQKKLIIHDENTITEFTGFILKGKSYEADKGFHDDLVMTLVLFAFFTTTPEFKYIKDNYNKMEVYDEDYYKQMEEELAPFGFIIDGTEEEEPVTVEPNGTVWTNIDGYL